MTNLNKEFKTPDEVCDLFRESGIDPSEDCSLVNDDTFFQLIKFKLEGKGNAAVFDREKGVWELTQPTEQAIKNGTLIRNRMRYLAGLISRDSSGSLRIVHSYKRGPVGNIVDARLIGVPEDVMKVFLESNRLEIEDVLGWWVDGIKTTKGDSMESLHSWLNADTNLVPLSEKDIFGLNGSFKGELVMKNGIFYIVKPMGGSNPRDINTFRAIKVTEGAAQELASKHGRPVETIIGCHVYADDYEEEAFSEWLTATRIT